MRQMPCRTLYAALASLLVALGIPVTAVSGAEPGSVRLSLIAGGREETLRSRFDRNALPPGSSDATFQNGEMFQLSGSDMPPLIVAPIQFDTTTHATSDKMRFDCGAFFLDTDGHRTFARTTAVDSPLECLGLVALGAMPHEGPRPRLLFIYDMDLLQDMSGRRRSEIDVLAWSMTQHKYEADRPLSRWLTAKLPHPTIARTRYLLAVRNRARR